MTILSAPATAAAKVKIALATNEVRGYSGWGFSGSDAWTLQVRTADDTYEDYVDPDTGENATLSATGNFVQVQGPFVGRWYKATTTGSVGLRGAL